jgi:glyoxylase-like metal-dependent hydrolase (beta-lactamase superfamily II)
MQAVVVPVTPFQQNCTVLWCETTRAAAVVDPGGDLDRVLHVVRERELSVERILLTHGHLDHAGGAAALSRRLHVPVEGPHRDDAFLLDALTEQGRRYGLADCESIVPDRWLDDGDRIEIGTIVLEVIHCPGHTPGHVVFFERSARIALVGDVLFRGSVGRTDFPRGSWPDLVASIRGRLFPLGEDVTFVSGHGDTSTFGWEKKCNPFVSDLAVEA